MSIMYLCLSCLSYADKSGRCKCQPAPRVKSPAPKVRRARRYDFEFVIVERASEGADGSLRHYDLSDMSQALEDYRETIAEYPHSNIEVRQYGDEGLIEEYPLGFTLPYKVATRKSIEAKSILDAEGIDIGWTY